MPGRCVVALAAALLAGLAALDVAAVGPRAALLPAGAALARSPLAATVGGAPSVPSALSPKERKALDIVSIQAAGAEEAGLTVVVTFAGNLEQRLGRGKLRTAIVALTLTPKDPEFSASHLATRGPGGHGRTLVDTQSSEVGIVRDGRKLTFFVGGPGAENVARVTVRAFATFAAPGAGRAPAVDESWWDAIDQGIAADQAFLDDPLHAPQVGDPCAMLERLRDSASELLRRAKQREQSIKDMKRYVEAKIPQLEADLESQQWAHAAATLTAIGTSFGTPLAIVAGGPGYAGLLAHALALKQIQSAREAKQQLRDAIRNLKLDLRLADAFVDANRALIEKIAQYKGRIEGMITTNCSGVRITPTWAHNPPLGKSNVCVDFVAERDGHPPAPISGTYRVRLTGPSVSLVTPRTPLENGKGRAIGTITRAGSHTAEIEVFDETGARVAQVTHAFVVAEPPQDGPPATPPCPKPTQ